MKPKIPVQNAGVVGLLRGWRVPPGMLGSAPVTRHQPCDVETTMAEDRKTTLQKALARRSELDARINQTSGGLSTEEWDEFFALAKELHRLGHLKPEAADDGPTP
jgi:hypothetical protein